MRQLPLAAVITTPFIDRMLTFLWLLSKLQFPPLYSSNSEVYFSAESASFLPFQIVGKLRRAHHSIIVCAVPCHLEQILFEYSTIEKKISIQFSIFKSLNI